MHQRALWTFCLLVLVDGIEATGGEDGKKQPPGKEGCGGGRDEILAQEALERALLSYAPRVDPNWLVRVVSAATGASAEFARTEPSAEEARDGSASGSGDGEASVAATGSMEAGSSGVDTAKVSARSSAATGSSIYDRSPNDDDEEEYRARQRADRVQDEGLDAVTRMVGGNRQAQRLHQPGVLALQELDRRIRTVAGLGPDDADNPRRNIACLGCLQKAFDRHEGGVMNCPHCGVGLRLPADADAFTGTEDALEFLTGVPLDRLRKKAKKAAKKARKDKEAEAAAYGEGEVVDTGAATTSKGSGAAATTDFPKDELEVGVVQEGRSASGASGSHSAVSDARSLIWLSFGLAEQLQQRAAALHLRAEQANFAARELPQTHTSAGPTADQVASLLHRMPEEIRFPPELLDAILAEAVGSGAYVNASDSGDFDVAPGDGRDQRAASSGAGSTKTTADRARGRKRKELQEATVAEENAEEAEVPGGMSEENRTALLGPVPEGWLEAARSWHRARRRFADRIHDTKRRGYPCPCGGHEEKDGRFYSPDFRGYTHHFGSAVFGFRFPWPRPRCTSSRRTREQFTQHLRESHGLPDQEYEEWLRKHLGSLQSSSRGPTRLDPFFRPSETVLIDEPLPPKEWKAYLASLRASGASDGGGGDGGSAEGSGDGDSNHETGSGGCEGGQVVEDGGRAAGAGEPARTEEATAKADEANGMCAAKAATMAASVAVLAGSGSSKGAKKASKRSRKETSEGGDAPKEKGKKRKDGSDSDFNPDPDSD
ncbi:hypothetical protein AAVH_09120 [Aphelenchoides avenae]|nr:hypothetical protein AAVH_09120 [Aphelenchus avenae]